MIINYCHNKESRVISDNEHAEPDAPQRIENYDPTKQGAVVAIRIYFDERRTPLAELAFAFGGSDIIEWTNAEQRDHYAKGINGYTYIYDEREKRPFKDWIKPRH